MHASTLRLTISAVSATFIAIAGACDVPDVHDESIEADVLDAEDALEIEAEEAEADPVDPATAAPVAAIRWDRDADVPRMGPPDELGRSMHYDDQMLDIQADVPEFAGLWLADDEQVMEVAMTEIDERKLWTIEQRIRFNFGETFIPAGGLRAVEAKYNFRELKALQNLMTVHQMSSDEVVMTDVDEARNLVMIGVTTPEAMARVNAFGREIGAEGAFVVEYREPIRPLFSLTSRNRPAGGGVRISRIAGQTLFLCSMGLHAKRNGVKGFITASHCSSNWFATDSTQFWQATNVDNVIGTETYDKPGFTGGTCPAGKTCRATDAAFSTFSDASAHTMDGSTTKRPVAWPTTTNTTTFEGWGFVQTQVSPAQNATVQKVGQSTGRTKGTVSQTCSAVAANNTPYIMTCTHTASFGSASGDSGGAVFRNTSGTDTLPNLEANGIFWGTNAFCPIGSVNSDLGTTVLPG